MRYTRPFFSFKLFRFIVSRFQQYSSEYTMKTQQDIRRLINRLFISSVLALTLSTSLFMTVNSYADILFNAKIYGPTSNIFSINENGDVTKLTTGNNWKDIDFSFSPKHGLIFSSNRQADAKPSKTPEPYQFNLFLSSVGTSYSIETKNDGTKNTEKKQADEKEIDPVQITTGKERKFSPKFNANHSAIAYLKIIDKTRTELRLFDIKTQEDIPLVSAQNIYDFNWSPKKDAIAFSSSDNNAASINLFDIKSKKTQMLISQKIDMQKEENTTKTATLGEKIKQNAVFLISPTWSPNAKYIAYISHPLNHNAFKQLHVLDVKTQKTRAIPVGNVHVQSPISWSNDNQSLLYAALKDYEFYYDETLRDRVYKGGMHIFTTPLNGKPKQLTEGDHFFGHPVFSPMNDKIAFLYSDKLGDARKYALKTMDLQGKNIKELYTRVAKESSLLWIK